MCISLPRAAKALAALGCRIRRRFRALKELEHCAFVSTVRLCGIKAARFISFAALAAVLVAAPAVRAADPVAGCQSKKLKAWAKLRSCERSVAAKRGARQNGGLTDKDHVYVWTSYLNGIYGDPDSAEFYFGLTMGLYPLRGNLDCGVSLARDGVQYAFHGSRRAPVDPHRQQRRSDLDRSTGGDAARAYGRRLTRPASSAT